jgi:hypothetical protein
MGNTPDSSPTYWALSPPYCSFRVERSPVAGAAIIKNAAQSLQLPAATVIDLVDSGVGVRIWDGTGDVAILFAPNGAIEGIYVNGVPSAVTDPIFLLVGKRERIPFDPAQYDANNPDTYSNWQDLSNLWVVINPQTGLVTTGEMAAVTASNWNSGTSYAIGVVVRYTDKKFYTCIQATSSVTPGTDLTYWVPSGSIAARSIAVDSQGLGGK